MKRKPYLSCDPSKPKMDTLLYCAGIENGTACEAMGKPELFKDERFTWRVCEPKTRANWNRL